MKGVIVQVGEPKSIVLFNNGKIGAIPTPADCHVGMVVSVKLNNKLKILALCLAAVLLVALGVGIGTAFRGQRPPLAPAFPAMPGPMGMGRHGSMMMGHGGRFFTVTAREALELPDDTRVLMTGAIVESLGDEKYTFRDASGEIMVEIDRKLWRDLSLDVSDTVEVLGEVDVGRRRVVVDIKSVRKL